MNGRRVRQGLMALAGYVTFVGSIGGAAGRPSSDWLRRRMSIAGFIAASTFRWNGRPTI